MKDKSRLPISVRRVFEMFRALGPHQTDGGLLPEELASELHIGVPELNRIKRQLFELEPKLPLYKITGPNDGKQRWYLHLGELRAWFERGKPKH